MTARDPASRDVWFRFIKTALIWFIPALLALPVYLVLLAISAIGGDGALLETTEGVRGGINAALGPLLVVCGLAAGAFTAIRAGDVEDYLTGGFAAAVCVGFGALLWRRALEHLREARPPS